MENCKNKMALNICVFLIVFRCCLALMSPGEISVLNDTHKSRHDFVKKHIGAYNMEPIDLENNPNASLHKDDIAGNQSIYGVRNSSPLLDLVGFRSDGVVVALNSGQKSFLPGTLWIRDFGYSAGGWKMDMHPRFVIDVNGDNLPDVVGFGESGVIVSLNSGQKSFLPGTLWLGEFGYLAGGWKVDMHPRFVVDVNGDNYPDVVGFANDGVIVALNSGQHSFLPGTTWIGEFGYVAGGWRVDSHPRLLIDIDGDTFPDVVGFSPYGVTVALNSGKDSFRPSSMWIGGFGLLAGGWKVDTNPRFIIDVDSDNLPDVVGFANNGVIVALNSGKKSFKPGSTWINDFGLLAGGWKVDINPRFVIDVNGDGLHDIVGFANHGVVVALNSGHSFLPASAWINYFGYSAGGWKVDMHPRLLIDVNGDNLPDVVGFGDSGVIVALNSGQNAFLPDSIWIREFGYAAGSWRVDTTPRFVINVY